jgi:hypothetical protein
MASDQIEDRRDFSDLLSELGDSDVVIELAGNAATRRSLDLLQQSRCGRRSKHRIAR